MENERILSDSEFEDAYESAVNKAYDMAVAIAQDAKSITARDKWWIKEMELHHDFTALGHTPPQMHFIFSEPEWQSLKQSLEVKGRCIARL